MSNLVDRVEVILTQKPQQKKRYKRYRNAESRKQRGIENHPLLPGFFSICSKQCSKHFTVEVRARINKYTGICHQKTCNCNGCRN